MPAVMVGPSARWPALLLAGTSVGMAVSLTLRPPEPPRSGRTTATDLLLGSVAWSGLFVATAVLLIALALCARLRDYRPAGYALVATVYVLWSFASVVASIVNGSGWVGAVLAFTVAALLVGIAVPARRW